MRAVGPWAPALACLAFLGVAWLMDLMLRLVAFDRYTLTPIFALPGAVLSLMFWLAGRRRDRAWLAVLAGLVFVAVFVPMEAAWMRWVVARPWPMERLLVGLPRVVVAGALSGWVG